MDKIKVVENFITEHEANILLAEMRRPSSREPYPDYWKNRNGFEPVTGGSAIPYNQVTRDIMRGLAKRANLVQKEHFNLDKDVIVTKSFGSCWHPGGKGNPHIDAIEKEPFIEQSCVIYLNDEYEGGKIYFPRKNFSIKPKKFSAIFFPGNSMEYEHGVSEVTAGIRWTALFMQSTQKEFMDPDYEGC